MKKFISLLLATAMTVALVACGSKEAAAPAAEAPAAEAETETEEEVEEVAEEATEETADAEGMKILFVSSPSGVDDGSFNQNSYKGVEDFVKAHPECTSIALKEESGDTEACRQFVEQNVADYDAIVCCGFQFAAIGDIADDNPDKFFILVDSTPTYEDGSDAECANIYSMCFAEQESGFFAGVAAALETKTNKVAVVNGIAYPSNVNYQYGFMCGVKYANAVYGTTAELVELPSYAGTDVTSANVGGNYIGSFADQDTGKVVGEALIKEGVDVMLVAAGDSGNGVFTAAKETENVMVIGCDADQYDFGDNGSRNIILTSVLKCMDINNERQLNAINDGTFKGGNFTLDATTDSTGYISAEGRQQLSADTLTKLAEAYEAVKSGAVVPAANFNGITPDTFEVK
ncbi:MAG: BMP family ABC transporter substrate-binding protein [Lachnospiraceae bacterium]|nr:BMP family ABC transporter substrate-binding protein [Lachnospiraceae bacterium]